MEESHNGMMRSWDSIPSVRLAELRKESSASAVAFSDSCPCCGNKKRRCLLPSSSSRKKVLVFDNLPSIINTNATTQSLLTPSSSAPLSSSTSSGSNPKSSGSPSPSPSTSPSPSPVKPRSQCSDPKPPATPPPPETADQRSATPASATALGVDADEGSDPAAAVVVVPPLVSQRSNSSVTSSTKQPLEEGCKEHVGEEVRVGVKCKCGIVREIVLIR